MPRDHFVQVTLYGPWKHVLQRSELMTAREAVELATHLEERRFAEKQPRYGDVTIMEYAG